MSAQSCCGIVYSLKRNTQGFHDGAGVPLIWWWILLCCGGLGVWGCLSFSTFPVVRLHRVDLGVCVTANLSVPELRFRKKSGKEVLFASSDRHMLNNNGYLRFKIDT